MFGFWMSMRSFFFFSWMSSWEHNGLHGQFFFYLNCIALDALLFITEI